MRVLLVLRHQALAPWDPVSTPPSAKAVPTPYMPIHITATITRDIASQVMTDRPPERLLIRACNFLDPYDPWFV